MFMQINEAHACKQGYILSVIQREILTQFKTQKLLRHEELSGRLLKNVQLVHGKKLLYYTTIRRADRTHH